MRDDNATEHQGLIRKLWRGIPSLKQRGAERLHGLLRAYAREAPDASLLEEQVATEMQDSIVTSLCRPFLSPLVACGGERQGLDVSHLAASLAQAGGIDLLERFLDAGYQLDRRPTSSGKATDGGVGAAVRCLGCPECCVKEAARQGTAMAPHPDAWFSAQHAAAAAGQLDTLTRLEARQGTAGGGGAHADGWPFAARDLAFGRSDLDFGKSHPAFGSAAGLEPRDPGDVDTGGASDARGAGVDADGGWGGGETMAGSGACGIDSVDGEAVMQDPRRFFERYVVAGRPVMVRRYMWADPALQGLEGTYARDALLRAIGDSEWETGEIPYEARYTGDAPRVEALRAFVARHIDGCGAGELCTRYIFAERFTRNGKEEHAKDVPELAPLPRWAELAKDFERPGGTQFYLGGQHSGTPMPRAKRAPCARATAARPARTALPDCDLTATPRRASPSPSRSPKFSRSLA